MAERIDRKRARRTMHAQVVGLAVGRLLVERSLDRIVRLDVVSIDAIHHARPQLARREELHQLVRKDDVDIRRQHEAAARAADPRVLADHLEQRQHAGMRQALVQRLRDLDEPQRDDAPVGLADDLMKPRPFRRRIPLDDDQLGVEAESPALRVEGVDEGLQARQRIAAVTVVPRGHDDAQVRRGGARRLSSHAGRRPSGAVPATGSKRSSRAGSPRPCPSPPR